MISLNAALKSSQASARGTELARRAGLAAMAAQSTRCLLQYLIHAALENDRLELPQATLAALAGGAALSLEAGPATVAALWPQCIGHQGPTSTSVAIDAADKHVATAGELATTSFRRGAAPAGWQRAAAPLLAPRALLALLQAAVPPLLWRELHVWDDRSYARVHNIFGIRTPTDACMDLANVLRAVGDACTAPGWALLAEHPQLQRSLAHLLACQLRRLVRQRELLYRDANCSTAAVEAATSLQLAALAGGAPAPFAAWAFAQSAAAAAQLGATLPRETASISWKR